MPTMNTYATNIGDTYSKVICSYDNGLTVTVEYNRKIDSIELHGVLMRIKEFVEGSST